MKDTVQNILNKYGITHDALETELLRYFLKAIRETQAAESEPGEFTYQLGDELSIELTQSTTVCVCEELRYLDLTMICKAVPMEVTGDGVIKMAVVGEIEIDKTMSEN